MGLFKDSLKKWFYTNNSSAASSDARVPLLNADGTPKGSDTMANLASVLGATTISITDWDNVPFYGMFSSAGTTPNAPAQSGFFTGFQFLNTRHQHVYQVAARSSDLTIYIRVKTSLSGSWGSWNKIEPTAIA